MPHLDHTGPLGQGPKTGRKLGKCKKSNEELCNVGKLGEGLGLSKKAECNQKGKRINYNR